VSATPSDDCSFSDDTAADQAPYSPYSSYPMMMIALWREISARGQLSDTAFNDLIRLLKKLVRLYPDVDAWPSNLSEIRACEALLLKVHATLQPACLLHFLLSVLPWSS
jgi:hypothetical protein